MLETELKYRGSEGGFEVLWKIYIEKFLVDCCACWGVLLNIIHTIGAVLRAPKALSRI